MQDHKYQWISQPSTLSLCHSKLQRNDNLKHLRIESLTQGLFYHYCHTFPSSLLLRMKRFVSHLFLERKPTNCLKFNKTKTHNPLKLQLERKVFLLDIIHAPDHLSITSKDVNLPALLGKPPSILLHQEIKHEGWKFASGFLVRFPATENGFGEAS